jgi:glycosyltransferase involved in cell wall biosynthesis
MKIGIVWEHAVSKYVTSPFEEFSEKHEVIVFIGEKNKYDCSLVTLQKIYLTKIKELKFILKNFWHAIKRESINPYKRMDFYPHSLAHVIDNSFDIIVTHDASRSLYTLCDLKKKRRFKLVVSYAENIPFRSIYDAKTEYIKLLSWQHVDLVIPWCKTIEKGLLQEKISNKILTIYQGVNTDIFYYRKKNKELIRKFGLSESKFTFSYIGKLVSWKGVQYILYAADILIKKGYTNFQITITGKGAQKKNIQQIIKKMQLENYVFLTGFVDYLEISKLFSISDVLVLPSIPILTWQEQYGMVIVESFACSKPVLGSNSGSIPEIIENGGLLHTPGNWFELSDDMIKVMTDKETYATLVRNTQFLTQNKYSIKVNSPILQQSLEHLYQNG